MAKRLTLIELPVFVIIAVFAAGSVWSQQVQPDKPYVPESSTVLLLHLDEGAGQSVKDASRNATGGVLGTYGEKQPEWIEGKFGKALQFTDSGLVTVPDSQSLNVQSGITIGFWVRYNQNELDSSLDRTAMKWRYVLLKEGCFDVCLDKNGWTLWLNVNGCRQFIAGLPGSLVNDGKWRQVMFTYDGRVGRTYSDGIMRASEVRNLALTPAAGKPLIIGTFPGCLDEVLVSDKVLTPAGVVIKPAADPAGW